MRNVTYCAVLLNAKSDGNEIFEFEAGEDLFRMPARDIVNKFIKHLINEGRNLPPITYKLDSAVKKKARKILMATGSLTVATGETSFMLMISPQIRERLNRASRQIGIAARLISLSFLQADDRVE